MTADATAVAGSYFFTVTVGTAVSAVATLTVAAFSYSIGGTGPAGGIIFYDKGSYSDGWRYLEAAPSDQSTGIQWYNGSNILIGVAATAIGTGAANTAAIVGSQGAGSYAAELCADLTLGGYSDWFLPSKDELGQMYVNLEDKGLGGFSSAIYWSSSEIDAMQVWGQAFDNGGQCNPYKSEDGFWVRAARAF